MYLDGLALWLLFDLPRVVVTMLRSKTIVDFRVMFGCLLFSGWLHDPKHGQSAPFPAGEWNFQCRSTFPVQTVQQLVCV